MTLGINGGNNVPCVLLARREYSGLAQIGDGEDGVLRIYVLAMYEGIRVRADNKTELIRALTYSLAARALYAFETTLSARHRDA